MQVLFLPPSSPDVNPIEFAFSTFKSALRAAGARNRDELEAAITAVLRTITGQDATAWFHHCGDPESPQLL